MKENLVCNGYLIYHTKSSDRRWNLRLNILCKKEGFYFTDCVKSSSKVIHEISLKAIEIKLFILIKYPFIQLLIFSKELSENYTEKKLFCII